jgi:plastocyanin
MRSTLPLALALAGGCLAGAAGAQYDPPGGGTQGPAECAGIEHVVRLSSETLTFQPASLVVEAGDVVCWTWGGGHSHNVRADDGSFNSGPPTATGSFQRTFDAAGSFSYHCQTHGNVSGGMRGSVVVQGGAGGDPPQEPGPGTLAPVGPVEVREDAGALVVTVERTGGTEGKASLRYTVAGGSAKVNKDFRKVNGALSWADGEGGARTFSVPIVNDGELEFPETFSVRFTKPGPRGVTLAASSVAVTLVDDDFSCETASSLAAPSGLRAAAQGPREVRLSWTREPAAATALRVERATPGGAFREIAVVGAGSRGFVDAGLAPGTTHLYRLRAEGPEGLTAYGETVAAATDAPTSACDGALCLHDGRFAAEVEWRLGGAKGGRRARPVPLDGAADAGLFALLADATPELLLDVRDGCDVNGHFWVSLAGVTEAELLVKVRDTATGRTWVHFNPEGSAPALRDVDALACP